MAGFQTDFVRRTFNSCATAAAARSALGILTAGSTTGTIFYVDSVSGSASGDALTPSTATTTVALAQALATASKGDIIAYMPKHAETVIAATEFAPAKVGITYISLGEGGDRATFTFSTNNTANIPVTAASCSFINLLFVNNKDGCTAAMTVSAADTRLTECEFRDGSTKSWTTPLLTTAGADRIKFKDCFWNGDTANTVCTEALSLIGVDVGYFENCRILGNYVTACVNLLTTASTLLVFKGCTFLETSATALTKCITDTQGSSTYAVYDCYDQATGRSISGNNTLGLSSSDGEWFYKSKADPTPLGSQTLFTYTGHIEFQIYAVVTTVLTAGATTFKWTCTPDSLTVQDLCATKDIDGFVAGSVITPTGTAITDAAIALTGIGVKSGWQDGRFLATCITSGIIAVAYGAATVGAITHYIRWKPVTPSATVV